MKVIQFETRARATVPEEERYKTPCSKFNPQLELMQKLNNELEYWEKMEVLCCLLMKLNVPGAEFLKSLVREMQNTLCFTIQEVLNNLNRQEFINDIKSKNVRKRKMRRVRRFV